MTLESSLLSDKAKPGNLIITGTDKTGALPISFKNLGVNPLDINLDIQPTNKFSVNPASVHLESQGTYSPTLYLFSLSHIHIRSSTFNLNAVVVCCWMSGADAVSTVSFASDSPTSSVGTLSVTAGKAIALAYSIRAITVPPVDFGERFGPGW